MATCARVTSFRDLRVWRLGKAIALDVYAVTGAMPRDERFGLCAQIRRAAVSIPSNVAEGFNRRHRKEYRQFLYVALGSCAELETQVEIACELDYIDAVRGRRLLGNLELEARMLQRLIRRLTDRGRPNQRPATSD